DGRLHAAGLTLRHDGESLALLDRATAKPLARAPKPGASARLFEADLPAPLRDKLAPLIEMRALTPRATVQSRFRRLAVLNEDDKAVVRLAEEAADGVPARLHATAVRGYDKDLARVRRVLAERLELAQTEEPLADAAIAAGGEPPAGTSSKLDVTL